MESIRKSVGLAMAVLVLGLIGSCTSTRLVEAWVDKSYQGGPLESIMVIGLSDNVRRRGMFEDALVAGFERRGVRAVASLSVAPDKESLDMDAIKRKVRQLGLKSIIVTRLVGTERETYYVPGRSYVIPYGYYYRFRGYYRYAYRYAYEPGYWAEYDVFKLETNLYDVATDGLVWSAASESIDPLSLEEVVASLSAQIIDSLSKYGLLRP